MRLNLTAVLAFVVVVCGTIASAAAEPWKVVQTIGEVTVEVPGISPAAVSASQALPNGATIATGRAGRAILLRGRESIVMSPMSRMILPTADGDSFNQVKQQTGTLLFKVGKKPQAHFEVDTPYLAAVVKGTTFTVSVGATGASVHVHEGAVEVATNDRRQSILTRTGQISSVFASSLSQIFTTGVMGSGVVDVDSVWNSPMPEVEIAEHTSTQPFGAVAARPQSSIGLRYGKTYEKNSEVLGLHAINRIATAVRHADTKLLIAQNSSITVNSSAAEIKTSDIKTPDASDKAPSSAIDKDHGTWTVIETKGTIKVDGTNYSVYGSGMIRTLPPGTKIETGADGQMILARGAEHFAVNPDTTVVLADAAEKEVPKATRGTVERFEFASGDDNSAANSADTDVAETSLQENADVQQESADRANPKRVVSGAKATNQSMDQTAIATKVKPTTVQFLPKIPQAKKEAVRMQVISGVTLFLYAITAALLMFFGIRAYLKRVRRRSNDAPEDAVTARVRQIKGD